MRDPALGPGSPFPGWQPHPIGLSLLFPSGRSLLWEKRGDEPMGCGPRVWMVASSAESLLFNIKSRARNCIKMCIIIPEEGRAQPLVIAGLL